MQSVTVPMLLCEPNPCAVRGRRTPGEDDEQEDPVMQGLRDDVARGLDDDTRRWCARRRSEREYDHRTRGAV